MADSLSSEPIKAERSSVEFFDGLSVDGYRMPNGEFRIGLTGASEILGYGPEWLGRALSRGGNTIKALRSIGFTEEIQKVAIKSGRPPETISLRDFNRLISYAVFDKKPAALALQLALTELSLTDFFRDSFGEPPLSVEEKRKLFYEAYASTISPEDWRAMDREDILRLAMPGDEKHLKDGKWNN